MKKTNRQLAGLLAITFFTSVMIPIAAHAGHELEQLHTDLKALDNAANHLVSDYTSELKKRCAWKPCGRERTLYDAMCRMKKSADQMHRAFECNRSVRSIQQHLCAIRTAIDQGVDIRGYMAWSLMDNYEWSLGYAKRFGIIHVDFESLERTPKVTARYYSKIIESNGAVLDEPFLPLSLHTRHG